MRFYISAAKIHILFLFSKEITFFIPTFKQSLQQLNKNYWKASHGTLSDS